MSREMSRQFFNIKTSGMFLKDVEDWEKEIQSLSTEPTPEESKSEYMKYFLRPMTMPSMENITACERDNAIPAEEALMPQDFGKGDGFSKSRYLKIRILRIG